jgi:hypothetical protein
MRITWKHIEDDIRYLNKLSKKQYVLEGAYGKVRLCVCVNGVDTRNGISDITPLLTKGELNIVLRSIINFIRAEASMAYKDKTE